MSKKSDQAYYEMMRSVRLNNDRKIADMQESQDSLSALIMRVERLEREKEERAVRKARKNAQKEG